MTSATRDALLKLALPLVKNHGFTRSALSLAAMYSPSGKHTAPLNDTAVDALFGEGDEARRTFINAWLADARLSLRTSYNQGGTFTQTSQTPSLENVLKLRLSKNEEVLEHLPEVSASPNSEGYSRCSSGIPNHSGFCSSCYTSNAILTRLSFNARSPTGDLPLDVHRRGSMSTERRHQCRGKVISINPPFVPLRLSFD